MRWWTACHCKFWNSVCSPVTAMTLSLYGSCRCIQYKCIPVNHPASPIFTYHRFALYYMRYLRKRHRYNSLLSRRLTTPFIHQRRQLLLCYSYSTAGILATIKMYAILIRGHKKLLPTFRPTRDFWLFVVWVGMVGYSLSTLSTQFRSYRAFKVELYYKY